MNTELLVQCGWPGLLGILFQIVVKLVGLKRRSKAANKPFHPGDYFVDDWLSIVSSVLAVIIFIVCLENLAHWKPAIMQYVQMIFIAVGYMGSSLINAALSKSEKQLLEVIDKKTNYGDLLKGKMDNTMGNTVTITQTEMDSVTPETK